MTEYEAITPWWCERPEWAAIRGLIPSSEAVAELLSALRMETDRNWEDKIRISPSGCLEHRVKKGRSGRPTMYWHGKDWYVTRVVWAILYGATELDICHHCDNPPCFHPFHLFAGTHTDNMRDMHAKGRWRVIKDRKGEANGLSRLTEEAVREIRRLRGDITQVELARRYGVSQSAISLVHLGKAWTHVC